MDLTAIGLNIIKRRKSLNLTQDDISEKTGITQPNICKIENGLNSNPSVNTLQRIADALGCDLLYLLETESGSDLLNS